jgi:hypothetical protein
MEELPNCTGPIPFADGATMRGKFSHTTRLGEAKMRTQDLKSLGKVAALLTMFSLVGCGQRETQVSVEHSHGTAGHKLSGVACPSDTGAVKTTRDAPGPPHCEPSESFPCTVGMSWRYAIEVASERDPLAFEEVVWAAGSGRSAVVYATRRRLFAPRSADRDNYSPRKFILEIVVRDRAKAQGPLR